MGKTASLSTCLALAGCGMPTATQAIHTGRAAIPSATADDVAQYLSESEMREHLPILEEAASDTEYALAANTPEKLAEGIEHRRWVGTNSQGQPANGNIVQIDFNHSDLKFVVTEQQTPETKCKNLVFYPPSWSLKCPLRDVILEKTSDFSARKKAAVAFNTSFFHWTGGSEGLSVKEALSATLGAKVPTFLAGMAVIQGVKIHGWRMASAVNIGRDNSLTLLTRGAGEYGTKENVELFNVINGAEDLLRDGQVVARDATNLNPYTALAWRGKKVIVFVVNGRGANRSEGVTSVDVAEQLKAMDMEYAIRLDGGGSSAMASYGRLLNVPSDKGPFGRVERPVGFNVGVAVDTSR